VSVNHKFEILDNSTASGNEVMWLSLAQCALWIVGPTPDRFLPVIKEL